MDAQSGLGFIARGLGGGATVARAFTRALEQSVGEHFGHAHAIHCMCHSTEQLYAYNETNLARACDDYYPRDPASHAAHVAAAACNSLFLGQVRRAGGIWEGGGEGELRSPRIYQPLAYGDVEASYFLNIIISLEAALFLSFAALAYV